jgi:hypothetical protein
MFLTVNYFYVSRNKSTYCIIRKRPVVWPWSKIDIELAEEVRVGA